MLLQGKLSKRDKYLRKKYGITEAEYNKMANAQHGVCGLCGRPPKTRSLSVDHDHGTGRVRGLLCYNCNRRLIGRFRRPDLFRKAAEYLERKKAVGL